MGSTKYSWTSGKTEIRAKVVPDCRQITIWVGRGHAALPFGRVSHEPRATLQALRRAGLDPATRREFPTLPPLALPVEVAAEIDKLSIEWKERNDQDQQERAARLASIEGLQELRTALKDHDRYQEQFVDMMEDELNDGVNPPRHPTANIPELRERYPRAAAYLRAEEWSGAHHYAKATAGKRAMEAILAGEDHGQAIATMETAWSDHVNEHIWD